MDNKNYGHYLPLALGAIKIIADVVCVAATVGMVVLFGLQFPHAPRLDSVWLVQILHWVGDPVLSGVASILGWAWPSNGISLLPIGGGFAMLLARQGLDALMVWLRGLVSNRFPPEAKTKSLSTTSSSGGISVSSSTIAQAAISERVRAKIQRRHDRVARLLRDAKHRWCAFLSIDIVDAVELKQGADPERVTRTFNAYEEMLEEIFQLTKAWKVAWTTDGVMVCFLDDRQALDAAQRVLKGLKVFNAGRNELQQPFRVRCGLNEGEVVIFEDSKLEKVADHVIDVAGHMQKHARPNSLWLSSDAYEHLEEKLGFQPANARVDDLSVFEWRA